MSDLKKTFTDSITLGLYGILHSSEISDIILTLFLSPLASIGYILMVQKPVRCL